MPPPPAIPTRVVGRGGWGSHLCESNRSPLRGTSLPPRRQRESYLDNLRSPAAPLSPGPLETCRGHADHVPWGRLPACNKAIDQDGQHVVGRRCVPPSYPLRFSRPANPPILLFAQLIFQSRSYKFSTPNFPLSVTKKKVLKTTLCTTVRAQLSPKYPGFSEGVLELLYRDMLCPSWKYDNGRIFKITCRYSKKILLCVQLYTLRKYLSKKT